MSSTRRWAGRAGGAVAMALWFPLSCGHTGTGPRPLTRLETYTDPTQLLGIDGLAGRRVIEEVRVHAQRFLGPAAHFVGDIRPIDDPYLGAQG